MNIKQILGGRQSYQKLVWRRRLIECFFFFIFQWVGLKLSLGHHLPLIWFFQGVNVAFVAIRGYRLGIPIFFASLPAFAFLSIGKLILWTLLQTLLPTFLVWATQRFFGPLLPWRSGKVRLGFTILAALVCGFEMLVLWMFYPESTWSGILTGFLGAWLGVVMIAPMFFVWAAYIPGMIISWQKRLHHILAVSAIVILGLAWVYTVSIFGLCLFLLALGFFWKTQGMMIVSLGFALLGVLLGILGNLVPAHVTEELWIQGWLSVMYLVSLYLLSRQRL